MIKDLYKNYMYSYPHKTAYREIKNMSINDLKYKIENTNCSLYFHIPFCKSKCGYCNLFSITRNEDKFVDDYVESIQDQILQYNLNNIHFDEIVIGGGTPLILNTKNLDKIYNYTKKLLNVDLKNSFSVIETSPSETTEEKISLLKEHYTNRISIGVQSFVDEELLHLNRLHKNKNILKALNIIKNKKFDILNIDIIYGIKNQTENSLLYSLENAIYFEPEEIFLYPLYIRKSSNLEKPLVDKRYELYLFAKDYLKSKGYIQSSMRKFSKNKNLNESVCGFKNNISFGCGGRSYIDNIHFCETYSNSNEKAFGIIKEYILKKDKAKINNGFILNKNEQKRRFIIKNLFFYNGFTLNDYNAIFESNCFNDFKELNDWKEKKYLIIDNERIFLTEKGISLSDYLGPKLISKEVKNKMVRL